MIKAAYDPANIFRLNQNITPRGCETENDRIAKRFVKTQMNAD